MLLAVSDIHTYYGASHVLHGVALEASKGDVVCVLGRNGAGKTTLVRSIIGMTPPVGGSVLFDGLDITNWPLHRRARLGITVVPQGRRIFGSLSVSETLRIAGRWGASDREGRPEDEIFEWFPNLKDRKHIKGRVLSGGEQQMLATARALKPRPRLVVMDEPSEGLAPALVRQLVRMIIELREEGVTVLLVEQRVRLALGVSSYGYVMEKGRIVQQGTAASLAKHESLLRRHLGTA